MSNKKRLDTLYSIITMYEKSKGHIFRDLNKHLNLIKPKLTEYENICLKSKIYTLYDKVLRIIADSSLSLYRYEKIIPKVDFDHLFDDLDDEYTRLTTSLNNEKTP